MSFIQNTAADGFEITTSDTVDFTEIANAIYIGVGGNVRILTPDGTTLNFIGVPAGAVLPFKAIRVFTTGTTASSLVAATKHA